MGQTMRLPVDDWSHTMPLEVVRIRHSVLIMILIVNSMSLTLYWPLRKNIKRSLLMSMICCLFFVLTPNHTVIGSY